MSRLVERPVTVVAKDGVPCTVVDRGEQRRVSVVIDSWDEVGKWWENELEHHVFRVVMVDGAVLDLDHTGDTWMIYRVWD